MVQDFPLEGPVCIISAELLPLFEGVSYDLKLHTVDELKAKKPPVPPLSLPFYTVLTTHQVRLWCSHQEVDLA